MIGIEECDIICDPEPNKSQTIMQIEDNKVQKKEDSVCKSLNIT